MNKNKIAIIILTCIIIGLGIFIFFNFIKEDKKASKVFNIDCGDDCDVKGERTDNPEPTPEPTPTPEPGGNEPCTGDNCTPSDIPCEGDNCVPGNTPCTGDNCVPGNAPCEGDNCAPCTGDNCAPSNTTCVGDNCQTGDGTGNSDVPTEEPVDDEDFFVSDNVDMWRQQDEINIFDVPGIAPGYSGTYDFVINNNTKSGAVYAILFEETNIHKANVLYKLKRTGEYIAGDEDTYVSYDKLSFENRPLYSNQKDYYTVEWKWVDADNDTEVGRTPNATYTLKISVSANEASDVLGERTNNPFTGDNLLFYISVGLLSILSLILLLLIKKEVNRNESN